MHCRTAALLLTCAALLAGCGRQAAAEVSTTPTSLPAGDTVVTPTYPAMGGTTRTSAGVVD